MAATSCGGRAAFHYGLIGPRKAGVPIVPLPPEEVSILFSDEALERPPSGFQPRAFLLARARARTPPEAQRQAVVELQRAAARLGLPSLVLVRHLPMFWNGHVGIAFGLAGAWEPAVTPAYVPPPRFRVSLASPTERRPFFLVQTARVDRIMVGITREARRNHLTHVGVRNLRIEIQCRTHVSREIGGRDRETCLPVYQVDMVVLD